jgi:hypothetical protein
MGRAECYLLWTAPVAAHDRCQLTSGTAVAAAAVAAEELGQAVAYPLLLSSPGNSKTVNNWTTFRHVVRQTLFCQVSMSVAPIITLESDDPTRESEMPIQGSKHIIHYY